MNEAVVDSKRDSPVSHAGFPLLVLLFVGSGCAALIYEAVWFQLLGFVIGASSVSLGVLLGTFMGGMCLGSYLLPRLVSPKHHPLRVYAWLELGIGFIGVLVLYGNAPDWWRLHSLGGLGRHRVLAAGDRGRNLSASSNHPHGSDPPRCGAMGEDDTPRRLVAGVLLWREHRRGGSGQLAGRILPAPCL